MLLRWLFLVGDGAEVVTAGWTGWVLTYWLHSLLLSAASAGLMCTFSVAPAARQRVWLAALIVPFFTSWLAFASAADGPRERDASAQAVAAPPGTLSASRFSLETTVFQSQHAAPAGARFFDWKRVVEEGTRLVVALWLLVGALRLVQLALAAHTLTKILHTRRPLDDPRLQLRLAQIAQRARWPHRLTLTVAAKLTSPLVVGRSEICVPPGLLTGCTDAEVDAMFAHELAHLERGDWFTFPAVRVLEALLCLQPLNQWLAACFRADAELACDERAVALTNDPVSLARVLTRLAGQAFASRALHIAPEMVRTASTALVRVRRLLELDASGLPSAGPVGRLGIALALIAVFSPSLSVGSQPPWASLPDAGRPPVDAQTLPVSNAAPDEEQLELELRELQLRETQLRAALAAWDERHQSSPGDSASTVTRRLEIEQELRHVRQTQLWTEERFEEQWHAWQRQQAGQLSP